MSKEIKHKREEEIQCPVCGYYCLGKGGHGCIDKPSLVDFDLTPEPIDKMTQPPVEVSFNLWQMIYLAFTGFVCGSLIYWSIVL